LSSVIWKVPKGSGSTASSSMFVNNPGGKVGVARRGASSDCPSEGSPSTNHDVSKPAALQKACTTAISGAKRSIIMDMYHVTSHRYDGARRRSHELYIYPVHSVVFVTYK
jgi:hypothetical protein